MLKEATEIVKAALEFFRSLKVVFTIFLCSALLLLPPSRNLFPIPKTFTDNVDLVASVALLLSGVYLVVTVLVSFYQRMEKWRCSEEHRSRKALAQASPLEKLVLEAVIHKGEYLIKLDFGSPIAVHLQEIGLIKKSVGLPYKTYQLATGLEELCLKTPALFRVPEPQQRAALDELELWKTQGRHRSFFNQLCEPSSTSWMG
jgi:hypothetical protein